MDGADISERKGSYLVLYISFCTFGSETTRNSMKRAGDVKMPLWLFIMNGERKVPRRCMT